MQSTGQRHRLHLCRFAVPQVHSLTVTAQVAALVYIAVFPILFLARGKNGANELVDKLPIADLRALPDECSYRRLEVAIDVLDCRGIRAALVRLHVCNAADHEE